MFSLFDVTDRVCVITGGGTGIVYITGRTERKLQEAVDKVNAFGPGKAFYCVADVTKDEDVQRFVKFVEEREDFVDILVNNAGYAILSRPATHEYSLEDLQAAFKNERKEIWEEQFAVNTWAPHMVTVQFLHLLGKAAKKGQGRGSVIMISSIASKFWSPWFNIPAYSAAKAGVEHLGKILAAKVYPHGIRVNTIAPGSFPTRGNPPEREGSMSHPGNSHRIPLKRSGSPDDIIGPVLFLASAASAYITGQSIDVDGGVMLVANGTNRIK